MAETTSSQSDFRGPESEAGASAEEIRERAERLQQKVGELSKTFDHIERTLAEAADDSEERASGKSV